MSTMTFTVNMIKALVLMLNEKDCREYCKGIFVRNDELGTRLVATNGHMLLEIAMSGNIGHKEEFFITIDQLKPLLKLKGDNLVDITNGGELHVSALNSDKTRMDNVLTIKLQDNDVVYPNYTRTIPESFNHIGASFNIDYLVKMDKARKLLGCKPFTIEHNGNDKASRLDFDDPNIVAIIMPLRSNYAEKKKKVA